MIKNYSEQESVDNFGAIQYDREQKYLNQKDLEQAQTNIGIKSIIDCVQSNSASWGGGTPIEMSGKLDSSAVGFVKYNSADYVSGISGKQISARYAQTAWKANNAGTASEAQYAYTSDVAYNDAENHPLQENYYNISSLSAFIQSNSSNWGGSSPTSSLPKVNFYAFWNLQDSYSSPIQYTELRNIDTKNIYLTFVENAQEQPSPITIDENTVYYSFDGTNYVAKASLSPNGYINVSNTFQYHNTNTIIVSGVSSKGGSNGWEFSGVNSLVISCVNSNSYTKVYGFNDPMIPETITTLANESFTASGYNYYGYSIQPDLYHEYYPQAGAVSCMFVSNTGSQVTSGDVLPDGPMDGNTYTLKWNTQSGLYWGV